LVCEIRSVVVAHVAVVDFDVARSDHDLYRLAKFGEIADCSGEGGEDGFGHVAVEFAAGSDGYRITIDHVESFLVDGML
jgi:hypothetical protein